LLSAIGIAGMDRMIQANVLATSGEPSRRPGRRHPAPRQDRHITLGNRRAVAFCRPRCTERDLASAAQLASLADETPEGRSIVVLAKERFALRGRDLRTAGVRVVRFPQRRG